MFLCYNVSKKRKGGNVQNMENKKIRKTLYLEKEIAKGLKILAAKKEISESAFVSALIKRELGSGTAETKNRP